METIKLRIFEHYKLYISDIIMCYQLKKEDDIIMVDSYGFLNSINDEPSYTRMHQGRKYEEAWYKHGYFHRLTGPACISYDSNGEIYYKEYWVENKEYSEEEFDRVVKQLENNKPSDSIKESKEELLECMQNLMGCFNTPIGRRVIDNEISREAIEIGNKILNNNK